MARNTVNILLTADDKASRVIDGVASSAKRFAKVASLAVGASLAAVGAKAITAAANLEQTQVAFETMLGNTEKARDLLTDLGKLASTTPFEINEVRQAAKQMLAYGIETDKIIETTKMLGDVAAGLGKETFPQLTLAFGQIKAKGKLMGQELLQLTNAGFNVAEAMGVTRGELMDMMESADGVSFEQVEEAFKRATSEGGRFTDMMEKQSQTIAGRWSNIKDQFTLALEDIGTRLLPYVSEAMTYFTDEVLPRLTAAFDTLTNEVIPAIQAQFEEWWPKIVQVATALKEELLPPLKEFWHTLKDDLIPTLSKFWHEVIAPLIPVLGVVFVAALKSVIGIMQKTAEQLNRVISVGNLLRDAFGWLIDKVRMLALKVGSSVGKMHNVFSTKFFAIGGFIQAVTGSIGGFIDKLSGAVGWVVRLLEKIGILKTESQGIDVTANQISESATDISQVKFASGGFTGTGGKYDVAGIVHKGEYVVPREQVNQSTGLPMMGSTININGNITLGDQGAVDRFFKRLDAQQQLAAAGMS